MAGRRTWHGQHWLGSADVARGLLARSSISPADLVVEIGAGTGKLTAALIERDARVIAYEIDPTLVRRLRARFKNAPGVRIVRADFLRAPAPTRPYRVVSNVPFHLTADIIRRLLAARPPPIEALLIVQREAAQRFVGRPPGRETLVSVLAKPWWSIRIIGAVPRNHFRPQPRVEVAILRARRRKQALVGRSQSRLYRDFVTFAFTSTGPTVKANLRRLFTRVQVRRLERDLPGRVQGTPGDVPFAQWLEIFSRFIRLVPEHRQRTVVGSHRRLLRREATRHRHGGGRSRRS